MTIQEKIDILNHKFIYRSDWKIGTWRILDLTDDGNVYGDCDDYAMTIAYILAGENFLKMCWMILTFQTVLWFCAVGEEKHLVVEYKGKYIDNIKKKFVDEFPYKKIRRKWMLSFMVKMIAGKIIDR